MPSFDRWDSLAQDYEMITDDWFKKKFDARTSPLSATEAKYLAQCKLKENRQQVVFELPNEEHARQKAREIKKELQQNQNFFNLIGKTRLVDAIDILSMAKLVLSNDSGLMHLSAATGIPTLGLFGPTDDKLYAPSGINSLIVRTPETAYEPVSYTHLTLPTKA